MLKKENTNGWQDLLIRKGKKYKKIMFYYTIFKRWTENPTPVENKADIEYVFMAATYRAMADGVNEEIILYRNGE